METPHISFIRFKGGIVFVNVPSVRMFKRVIATWVAVSISMSSVGVWAKESETNASVAQPIPMPISVQDLAQKKAAQQEQIPKWAKWTLQRKLKSFFPKLNKTDKSLANADVEGLVSESGRVVNVMEEDDPNREFRNFHKENLAPYIRSLKPGDIFSGMGQWTLQTLIVSRMLNSISQSKNFAQKAIGLVTTGKHLKGITKAAALLVLLSVIYNLPTMDVMMVAAIFFAIGTFWNSFQAGPIASILNAGSGWFVRPTSEQARVMESRYMARAEVKINTFYDRLNPKADPNQELNGAAPDRNDRVVIAGMHTHGMDFAGMTPNDQTENWENALSMFVVVAKRFGQLLRDTHHHGRDLMMLSWTDQQNVAQLVEVMESKRLVLRNEAESILTFRKSILNGKGEFQKVTDVDDAYDELERLCDKIWQQIDMNEVESQELAASIFQARKRLEVEFGFTPREIGRLLNIFRDKAVAISRMVTVLAIGELRFFYGAERNRNLAAPARAIEQKVREGLGMDKYVAAYLPQVQNVLRSMNLKVSGRSAPAAFNLQQCLIMELRIAFLMPPVVTSNTDKCAKLLWGQPEEPQFKAEEGSAIAELLSKFPESAQRNEAIAILNEAALQRGRTFDLQAGSRTALGKCSAH